MEPFNLTQINHLVLEKNHLTENTKADDIIQITEDLCGLHSTNLTSSYLSLFVRMVNFKKEDLETELYIKKTMGRIRGMRRTLFIQTKNLIPIVHAATFKLSEKSFEKYMEYHGITWKDYQEVSKSIIKILKGKELSASEIRKDLNSELNIPAIIQLMCNYGLLIRGRPIKDWKDRRNNYVLFSEYFPKVDLASLNEKDAIKQLVQRYIKSYGPVTESDISWWSGLTKTKIREALKAIESTLKKIKISSLKGQFILNNFDLRQLEGNIYSNKPNIILLPELDPYAMGYKERERYINSDNYNKVFDRSGNITATILLDGCIIGVWDTEQKPEKLVKLHLFYPIEEDLRKKIYSKAQELGKFIFESKVQIKEIESMTPLTNRTAGGFMTPLKNS